MADVREQAREMRKNPTPAERILWERLRSRRLHGLKFLRQYPIGPFIADFCCRDRRVIVELDGEVHQGEQQRAYDEARNAYLQGLHYVVLRFSNRQALDDVDSVVKRISNATHTAPPPWLRPRVQEKRKDPPNSPSPGEGGREGSGEGAGGGGLGQGAS